jgi:hypothetical protein
MPRKLAHQRVKINIHPSMHRLVRDDRGTFEAIDNSKFMYNNRNRHEQCKEFDSMGSCANCSHDLELEQGMRPRLRLE